MLRLWVSRNSTVSIREQLSAQLVLGIVSGRLAPGERLPSVRALARRLRIHPNTVSAAYSDLASRGWVGRRRGSGVFVALRRLAPRLETEPPDLNGFVRQFVEQGLRYGYSIESMKLAFLAATRPSITALVVADTDLELARVIAAEVGDALGLEVKACEPAEFILKAGDCLLGLAANEANLRSVAGADGYRTLKLKSMEDLVSGYTRPATPILIGMVSRSESIRRWAEPLLSSLGFGASAILWRTPNEANWMDGLERCGIVAADALSARDCPGTLNALVFRIVADDSIAELRRIVTPA